MRTKTAVRVFGAFAVVMLGIAVVASGAKAGTKIDRSVVINGNTASGALGSARNSANTAEYIGCMLDVTTTTPFALCAARDSSNNYKSCSTTNGNLLTTIAAINGDSDIMFYFDANGVCTEITVYQESYWAPKAL